MNSVTPVHQTQ